MTIANTNRLRASLIRAHGLLGISEDQKHRGRQRADKEGDPEPLSRRSLTFARHLCRERYRSNRQDENNPPGHWPSPRQQQLPPTT
ncbi:hypothetical protein BRAS3843_3040012 [Bradyrhizobium sp. STM 3843]|nr:hypothetical protein BRAS3843_3040012 [Bradyrhizobium sp. STM 3843]